RKMAGIIRWSCSRVRRGAARRRPRATRSFRRAATAASNRKQRPAQRPTLIATSFSRTVRSYNIRWVRRLRHSETECPVASARCPVIRRRGTGHWARGTLLFFLLLVAPLFADDSFTREADDIFVSYLRINTTNPPGNETAGARFLQQILIREGIDAKLVGSNPAR